MQADKFTHATVTSLTLVRTRALSLRLSRSLSLSVSLARSLSLSSLSEAGRMLELTNFASGGSCLHVVY